MLTIQGLKSRWTLPKSNDQIVRKIASENNLSIPISHALYSRGLIEKSDISSFLFTSSEEVASSKKMKDAHIAAERILQAVEKKEKILVAGDYDVDGITSTSVLLLSLLPLGAKINYHLPNRAREGYGLSVDTVKKAVSNNYRLIITVDNGITAHDAANKAKDLGIDLIITDHHLQHGSLPSAFAIVNPNQNDCLYPYKKLAGVGVAFKLMTLLYEMLSKPLPEKVYELLMLGTVADMVPLTDENRYWVRYGLAKINKSLSTSMSVLAANGRLENKSRLSSLDIGFMIAPQINALGRLDDSRDAVRFLISSDRSDVVSVGYTLKKMNEERKKVERAIYAEIEVLIETKQIDLEHEHVILAASKHWQSGVIGLVAGRLMQNYGRPTFLFHVKKDGLLGGSCRSIPEFDMFKALEQSNDLLETFGGHAHAAGLSLKQENVAEFKARIEEQLLKTVDAEMLQPRLKLDAYCELSDMTNVLLQDLERMEPFGNSNEQPAFLIKDVTLLKPPVLLKDQHVKCSFFSQGTIKQAIFFNRPDLYAFFNTIGESSFHVAVHVTKNEWQGRVNVELLGLDVAKVILD